MSVEIFLEGWQDHLSLVVIVKGSQLIHKVLCVGFEDRSQGGRKAVPMKTARSITLINASNKPRVLNNN